LSWFLLGTESKIIQVGAKTTPMPTPGAWAGIAGQANVRKTKNIKKQKTLPLKVKLLWFYNKRSW